MYSFLFRNVKMAAFLVILSIATYAELVYSIPPPQCSAKFRWDDCGKSPKPVMYYWKPGSRCEVGIWRGCLPNMNMFKDEYECVTTCIFTVRAADADFHQIKGDDDESSNEYDELPHYGSDDENNGVDFGFNDDNVTTVEGGTGGENDSNTTTDSADNLNSTTNKSDDGGDAATTPKDTGTDAESTTDSEVSITSESESVDDAATESETTTEETEPPAIDPES